jgi:hypothetical protein
MFAQAKVRTVQYVVLLNVYVYFLVAWKVLRPGAFHDWEFWAGTFCIWDVSRLGSFWGLGRFVFGHFLVGTFRGLDCFVAGKFYSWDLMSWGLGRFVLGRFLGRYLVCKSELVGDKLSYSNIKRMRSHGWYFFKLISGIGCGSLELVPPDHLIDTGEFYLELNWSIVWPPPATAAGARVSVY